MTPDTVQPSNSIEGYHVSLDDAVAAVDGDQPLDTQEDTVAWQAVVGYRRAMTYVLQPRQLGSTSA